MQDNAIKGTKTLFTLFRCKTMQKRVQRPFSCVQQKINKTFNPMHEFQMHEFQRASKQRFFFHVKVGNPAKFHDLEGNKTNTKYCQSLQHLHTCKTKWLLNQVTEQVQNIDISSDITLFLLLLVSAVLEDLIVLDKYIRLLIW